MIDWKPTSSILMLKKRAAFFQQIRNYFITSNVLEVDTPILSQFGSTDPNLAQWRTNEGFCLHTSPEYSMKRLLAAGSGDIFQICHVFRQDETGSRHNPEFTMLEWYRVGWDEWALMEEVANIIDLFVPEKLSDREYVSYQDAFLAAELLDPFLSTDDEIRAVTFDRLNAETQHWTRDECLDALMSGVVEQSFKSDVLTFIHSYPPSQAALARYGEFNGQVVGRRFELYWKGIELANGYFELTDAQEQLTRFERDLKERSNKGLVVSEIDQRFIAALENGMPSCAGVAMGLDRLLMILQARADISEVLPFDFDNA